MDDQVVAFATLGVAPRKHVNVSVVHDSGARVDHGYGDVSNREPTIGLSVVSLTTLGHLQFACHSRDGDNEPIPNESCRCSESCDLHGLALVDTEVSIDLETVSGGFWVT